LHPSLHERTGPDAIETEALSQSIIVGLVRSRLEELVPEPLADVLEREQQQRAPLLADEGG
jgi:hypothetical protein